MGNVVIALKVVIKLAKGGGFATSKISQKCLNRRLNSGARNHFTFDLPKIKGSLIIKRPTMLRNLVLLLSILNYPAGVSHSMWGNDLLGGGLCFPSAFPVGNGNGMAAPGCSSRIHH